MNMAQTARWYRYREDEPVSVGYEADDVVVTLANGEILRTPLKDHPWLQGATLAQRRLVEFDAVSIWWPELDEGLDIEGIRRQIPSNPTLQRGDPSVGAVQEEQLRRRIADLSPSARRLVDEFIDLVERTQASAD